MGFFMFQLARFMRYDMILMICREFSLKLVYGRMCACVFFFFFFGSFVGYVYVYCTQFRFRNPHPLHKKKPPFSSTVLFSQPLNLLPPQPWGEWTNLGGMDQKKKKCVPGTGMREYLSLRYYMDLHADPLPLPSPKKLFPRGAGRAL